MFNIWDLFGGQERDLKKAAASKEEAAKILKISPEALEAFMKAYEKGALDTPGDPREAFGINAKQAAKLHKSMTGKEMAAMSGEGTADVQDAQKASDTLIRRIVAELAAQTPVYIYDGEKAHLKEQPRLTDGMPMVGKADIMALPEAMRPQVSGNLMKKEIMGDAFPLLLHMYKESMVAKKKEQRQQAYHMFRQGLDIQDLDPVMYEILGQNRNSMGHWLPPLVQAAMKQDFFRIPKTTIIQVPMTLLQLTRLDYMQLTPATMKVVDEYCMQVFGLDVSKDYFIRTGTHSSKFDFRNARVHGEKEVRELGEYLLWNHHSGVMMAGPLTTSAVYGMATTREWCVREYIDDHDQPANPTIYKGLPLRTEIRVFVDMDTDKVIGIAPYWDPATMKKRFGHEPDADSPHQIHDYIIYSMHEDVLMGRYEAAKVRVLKELEKMLPDIQLTGQWSIDIMLNGKDADGKEEFWIIDMALAEESALKEYVPEGLLKPSEQNWLPKIQDLQEEQLGIPAGTEEGTSI